MSTTQEILDEVLRIFQQIGTPSTFKEVNHLLLDEDNWITHRKNWKEDVRFSVYRTSPHSPFWNQRQDLFRKVKKGIWRITSENDNEPSLGQSDGLEDGELDQNKPNWLVQRSIRLRRGQSQFRKKLLKINKNKCMITSSTVIDILEAAHIIPFSHTQNNQISNGLLLRSDIHTLFDLNLIGIDPDSNNVHLHPSITTSEYKDLDGRKLRINKTSPPSQQALEYRWELFIQN